MPSLSFETYLKSIQKNLPNGSERSHYPALKNLLDDPTFWEMRQSLEKTFDEIYLMDLHGNSRKKEVALDGLPDKNVFDIQQGVAVAMMVKYSKFVS